MLLLLLLHPVGEVHLVGGVSLSISNRGLNPELQKSRGLTENIPKQQRELQAIHHDFSTVEVKKGCDDTPKATEAKTIGLL